MAACGEVTCPFCVSRRSILQFAVERYSPDCQRTSPASVSCCPLCRTSYTTPTFQTAVNRQATNEHILFASQADTERYTQRDTTTCKQ